MSRKPRRFELGVMAHEHPKTEEMIQQLATGKVKRDGAEVPFLLAKPTGKEADRQIYVFVEGCKYVVRFADIAANIVAEHCAEVKLRPAGDAGSPLPKILGIPFMPPEKPVDEEKAEWEWRN